MCAPSHGRRVWRSVEVLVLQAMLHTPTPSGATLTMPPMRPKQAVRLADRIWDTAAVVLIAVGVALFAFARRALLSLAAGTYEMPEGMSYVARTDFHVTQSRIALWLIAVGVIVGAAAALRHRMRTRPSVGGSGSAH